MIRSPTPLTFKISFVVRRRPAIWGRPGLEVMMPAPSRSGPSSACLTRILMKRITWRRWPSVRGHGHSPFGLAGSAFGNGLDYSKGVEKPRSSRSTGKILHYYSEKCNFFKLIFFQCVCDFSTGGCFASRKRHIFHSRRRAQQKEESATSERDGSTGFNFKSCNAIAITFFPASTVQAFDIELQLCRTLR